MRVDTELDFVDLVNLELGAERFFGGDRWKVRSGQAGFVTLVTAGEAQVIAEAWNRIADEIVERERGAA